MKTFACGDVVPGCQASWTAESDDEILSEVARHAASDHGMTQVSDDLVASVRARIVAVS